MTWMAKRLSGNDTLANGSHQAGPYVPKDFIFSVFPSLNDQNRSNPDKRFELFIDSHSQSREIRAIWYNNKFHGGTRNEARITNFGGIESPLLDPENTGALVIFVFCLDEEGEGHVCHCWACRNPAEEDFLESLHGPIEPGQLAIKQADDLFQYTRTGNTPCWLSPDQIPSPWLEKMPSGQTIINKVLELRPPGIEAIDSLMVKRRACEFELFQSLEEAFHLPTIREGFSTIAEFLKVAQHILQSRKSRSGNSLELHTRAILSESGFAEGNDFSYQAVIENGKRPDFLFPSQRHYEDNTFPVDRLRLLAVKTTCKDRWRQVINEADRITTKHLLTLQEGISENQFNEMREANVRLVVPAPLQDRFADNIKPKLISLRQFLEELERNRIQS
jgi:hypothetical protein